jgi:hypothetical protein
MRHSHTESVNQELDVSAKKGRREQLLTQSQEQERQPRSRQCGPKHAMFMFGVGVEIGFAAVGFVSAAVGGWLVAALCQWLRGLTAQ